MLECARRYPQILVHSLITNMSVVPPDYVMLRDDEGNRGSLDDGMKLQEWIIAGGIGRVSYAILASQSCEDDVQELYRSERQRIVDRYNNKDCNG